jgi:hypothetical protein
MREAKDVWMLELIGKEDPYQRDSSVRSNFGDEMDDLPVDSFSGDDAVLRRNSKLAEHIRVDFFRSSVAVVPIDD